VPRKLAEYERKRARERTNEPFGDEPPEAAAPTTLGAFVVHLHDATRRHFDLRVEVGGVLASFALPRGPTFDPEVKHLAVHTEDHPIEYLDFEAVIPEGQYGAGPMILWDRGAVRYLEAPAEEGVRTGKLDMLLTGQKIRGRFALVRLKNSETGNEWLLIKKADAFVTKEALPEPRSLLSGLTVEELEKAPEIAAEIEALAGAKGGKASAQALAQAQAQALAQAQAQAQAHAKAQAQAHAKAKPPPLDDPGWIYEVKLDGARIVAEKKDDDVTLLHDGRDVTRFYPEIARAVRALPPAALILDGDAVAFEEGRPSMPALLRRIDAVRKGNPHDALLAWPVTYVVSDVLAVGALGLARVRVSERKEVLKALLRAPGVLRAAEHIRGKGGAVMGFAVSHGLPGVVARKDDGSRAALIPAPGATAPAPVVDHDAGDAPAALPPDAVPPVRFPVTNRTKIFWPEDGLTKGDLFDYYEGIAPVLLPYLRDRPVALVRYPDGIHGKSFFQWNVPPAMPRWMKSLALRPDEDEKGERTILRRGFLVNDLASLGYVANLGCIPIHVLAWRTASTEVCDFLTIDFDPPKEALTPPERLARVVKLARALHGILDAIGLPGFPKTSGQAGMHVLVPLSAPFEAAKTLCELLGRLVVKQHPDIATMERVVGKRGSLVYVDTGQTGHGRTIVAPYSVRAQIGGTVSTPLTWNEVDASLDPRAFTMKAVVTRVAKHGDPMKPLLATTPDVAAAATRLRTLFG
jgi:bifunctional non-homologous end joining protein LigD